MKRKIELELDNFEYMAILNALDDKEYKLQEELEIANNKKNNTTAKILVDRIKDVSNAKFKVQQAFCNAIDNESKKSLYEKTKTITV